jgi:hypothetical protein
MRKCIFSFFCVLALAACSPKTYSGVQEARASAHAQLYDSTAVSSWVRASIQEFIDEHFERVETLRTETVREILSAPDSAGRQHVVERSTTHTVSGAHTQAGTSTQTIQQREELRDSVAVADSIRTESAEIREEIQSGPSRDQVGTKLKWRAYLFCALALMLLGFYLGWKLRRDAK